MTENKSLVSLVKELLKRVERLERVTGALVLSDEKKSDAIRVLAPVYDDVETLKETLGTILVVIDKIWEKKLPLRTYKTKDK